MSYIVSRRNRAARVLAHPDACTGALQGLYRKRTTLSPLEIAAELGASLECALSAGVRRESIVLDPGLGFAKRPEHSYAALAGLPALAGIGLPLLVGPSRKSFLSAAIGDRPTGERDMATASAVAAAVLLGAHIVRVHNVRHVDVVRG